MRKVVFIFMALSLFLLSHPNPVFAKKMLPTRKGGGTKTSTGVATSVRFRSDRRAIVVTFNGISSARTIDYILSYNSRGTTQGAGGSLNPALAGNSTTRELLFGTCSHGVCRYDTGITNARLIITISLNSGKKIIRTYRLRV